MSAKFCFPWNVQLSLAGLLFEYFAGIFHTDEDKIRQAVDTCPTRIILPEPPWGRQENFPAGPTPDFH